jgi:tetratricopeptide (TPR) repeat protein
MFPTSASRPPLTILLGLAVLLSLAVLCYLPGLGGGFLFDDFVNLDALGKRGPIDNAPAFWRYLTSGTADPIGRPLALLSFLIDARDWPADPSPFLRTNLLLHLINGALLFLLLRQLDRMLPPGDGLSDAVALLATGLWLLHPLFVSTTLYIVQREAMLPASFSLLGLLLFMDARQRFIASRGSKGMAGMWLGLATATLLAMLSKANGVLLPLMAWVITYTVVRVPDRFDAAASQRLLRSDVALLGLPSLLVVGYLLHFLGRFDSDLATRHWTIGQRLLTEPRVLLDYLGLLVAPRALSTGLFNDEYVVSTSLWHPWATLPALLLVLALPLLALHWRNRMPRLAAAILFFFAGHLLESTSVPLELYFEHRNYLPALLLAWPLASATLRWRVSLPLRAIVATAMIGLLAATTAQRAALWGQPERLAAVWQRVNPDSPRAAANAAQFLMKAGGYRAAAANLLAAWKVHPAEVQLAFNYVGARCATDGLAENEAQAVTRTLGIAQGSHLLIHQWLDKALAMAEQGNCPGLDLESVDGWIRAAAENRLLGPATTRDEDFQPLLGELALARQQPDVALTHFRRALRANPTPDFTARLISALAIRGAYRQARSLLDDFEAGALGQRRARAGMPWLHQQVLNSQNFWPHEFAVLRSKLDAEIALAGGSPNVLR